MMKDILRLEKILDFYDEPQLFVARDKFDAQYLCLLYSDNPEPRYTAVKISADRLSKLLGGQLDLRQLFKDPENAGEYFDVAYEHNHYHAEPSSEKVLSEDKLPQKGYTLDTDIRESITVDLPIKDHGLFTELVRKFGWACM